MILARDLHSHVGRRGVLRLSAQRALYNLAVLVGRPQLVVGNSDQVVVAVPNSCLVAGGNHSRIV